MLVSASTSGWDRTSQAGTAYVGVPTITWMPAPSIASSARSTCVKSKTPGCGSSVLHVDSAMRTTLSPAAVIIATSVAMRSCGMYSS